MDANICPVCAAGPVEVVLIADDDVPRELPAASPREQKVPPAAVLTPSKFSSMGPKTAEQLFEHAEQHFQAAQKSLERQIEMLKKGQVIEATDSASAPPIFLSRGRVPSGSTAKENLLRLDELLKEELNTSRNFLATLKTNRTS